MTTTNPTFDAFEQRLVATLAAEAATTDVPPDGRARIDRRLAQRRRTRRTTWLAAAAALVLVAATVGLLLRDATDDSTPYVDTNPAGEMPLLGFEGQPMSVSFYVPGVLYVVPDAETLDNGTTISLVVWRSDSGYQPGVPAVSDGTPTTIAGQPATRREFDLGDGRTYQVAAFDPAPGWQAVAALEVSAVDGDPRTALAEAASRIGPVDRDTFMAAVEPDAPGPEGGEGASLPALIPADGPSGTSLLEVRPSSRLTFGFPSQAALPSPSALQVRVGFDRTPPPEGPKAVPLRGTYAVTYLSADPTGQPVRVLQWMEAMTTYVFRMPADLPIEAGTAFVDTLRAPTDAEWQALLFPEPPPRWPGEGAFDW